MQARISGSRGSPRDDAEKMELIQKLERADGRIQALEKQVNLPYSTLLAHMLPCADPESFFRGGPTFFYFFVVD